MKAIAAGWFLLCVIILAWMIASCGQLSNQALRGECGFVGSIALVALGFPLTLVWWVALSATAAGLSRLGIEIGLSPVFDAIGLVGLVAVGYFQWFMLLPRLWRKLAQSN